MPLETEEYIRKSHLKQLPIQNRIVGQTQQIDDKEYIIVYQAYNTKIAKAAVENQRLDACPLFSTTRMTWIKPNFLWMMYRCSWTQKDANQERVLAFWLETEFFEQQILAQAVPSRYPSLKEMEALYDPKEPLLQIYDPNQDKSTLDKSTKSSHVVFQWDPYHDEKGYKCELVTRALQIGIKGEVAKQFASGVGIHHIEDITEFVLEQYKNLKNEDSILIPKEREWNCQNTAVTKRLLMQ